MTDPVSVRRQSRARVSAAGWWCSSPADAPLRRADGRRRPRPRRRRHAIGQPRPGLCGGEFAPPEGILGLRVSRGQLGVSGAQSTCVCDWFEVRKPERNFGNVMIETPGEYDMEGNISPL